MNNDIIQEARKLAARSYPFQVLRDEESDPEIRYLARNPDLEGCMAQGATTEEAVANLADARIDYISFLLERGLPVPEPSEPYYESKTVSKPGILQMTLTLVSKESGENETSDGDDSSQQGSGSIRLRPVSIA